MNIPSEACPKCGYTPLSQPECPQCGIVVEKYEAMLAATIGKGSGKPLIYAKRSHRWFWASVTAVLIAAMATGIIYWFIESQQEVEAAMGTVGLPVMVKSNQAPFPPRGIREQVLPAPQPQDQGHEMALRPDISRPLTPQTAPPPVPEAQLPARPYYSSGWYVGALGYEKAKEDQAFYRVPVAVYFYTDWCPYCKKLDRDVLSDFQVSAVLDRVAKVRINPESGDAEKILAGGFGVTGYPSFFISAPGSQSYTRIPAYSKKEGDPHSDPGRDFAEACQRVTGSL